MKNILIIVILGFCCLAISCSEVSRDLKKAEQGDADAQYRTALRYHQGSGIEKDFTQAVKWYRMAAKQGLPEAQVGLALCYNQGEGLEQNDQETYIWLLVAGLFFPDEAIIKSHVEDLAQQTEQVLTPTQIEEAREEAEVRFDEIVANTD